MRQRNWRLLATCLSLCALIGRWEPSPIMAGEYDRFLSRIPGDANSLVLLNVESIFGSRLAQKEDWKRTYSDKFALSPLILPPNAKRFALGSLIQIQSMEPVWEVASMSLAADPLVGEVVSRISGVTDTIFGVETFWPQEHICIAKFAPSEFAVYSPASRQSASRWIDRVNRQQSSDLSPYLQHAVQYAENTGPEIIMAIDLGEILRPETIQSAVQQTDYLAKLDQRQVTDLLASLRGVTLGVRVTDRIYGKLLVDFDQDAAILEPVAGQLVLDVLRATGAMIDEFNDWQAKVVGKRVSIEGPLSTDGMRRLFSLVTLDTAVVSRQQATRPSPKPAAAVPASETAQAEEKESAEDEQTRIMGIASYRYFRSVDRYLNDLQSPRRSSDLSDIALWINNFARKIERLPAHNVDPDLRAYGEAVVYGMRDAVGYLHGVGERTADRQSRVRPRSNVTVGVLPTGRTVSYGAGYRNPWGYPMRGGFGASYAYNGFYRFHEYVPYAKTNVDVASALDKRDQIAEEEYQQGTDAANQIMENLMSETTRIRQVMTLRYGREF